MTTWANNTDNIPKRYRNVFCDDLFVMLNELVRWVKKASLEYPSNAERLAKRRKYIAKAINATDNIWEQLQWIYDTRKNTGGINLEKLEPRLTMLVEIKERLLAWKKAGLRNK